MSDAIDSGWAAWLPLELLDALAAVGSGAASRRTLRERLRRGPDPISAERWQRFRLVAPSRIDVPWSAEGLDEATCYRLLEELGLVAGQPPRRVPAESVELVLTLDHDDLRELERIRAARDVGGAGAPLPDDMPSLDLVLGAGTGRNEPCPCGSGKKFKRCHGR